MQFTVSAPNRIDLGGGTTDLFPLYLFMDGGCTINIAINVMSSVTFTSRSDSKIKLTSEDMGQSIEANVPADLPVSGPLGLVARAVRAFPPHFGMDITTRNEAPTGSGLGASSSLVSALLHGLFTVRGESPSLPEIVHLAMNLETASIGVPAGKQDHIASVYGGISVLEFDYNDFSRLAFPTNGDCGTYLQKAIILSFTGENRFSGMNNWEITKGYIEDKHDIRRKLIRIRDIAKAMVSRLQTRDWSALAPLIDEEWQIRKSLADGVSTPQTDAIMLAATEAGAAACKICGAGGGGCMIAFTKPEKRLAVEEAIVLAGGKLMPFTIEDRGLRLSRGAAVAHGREPLKLPGDL